MMFFVKFFFRSDGMIIFHSVDVAVTDAVAVALVIVVVVVLIHPS